MKLPDARTEKVQVNLKIVSDETAAVGIAGDLMAIRIRSEADSERASGRNRAGIGEGRRIRNGVRGDCRRNSQRFHINPASVRLLFQPCVGDNNAAGKDIRHQSKSGNFVHAERTSGGI